MRSFLFVPGDSARKFARATKTEADALILDLKDSVSAGQKEAARPETVGMLSGERRNQRLFVRCF